MMKRYGRGLLTGAFMLLLLGCAVSNDRPKALEACKIAVLLPGAAGDLSWNDTNMEGIEQMNNVEETEFEQVLVECGEQGYDLVLASGEQFTDSVNTMAGRYPDTFFCIVNGIRADHENVAAVRPR